jgi:hypothetical protein
MSLARFIILSLNMTTNARRGGPPAGPTRCGVARGRLARPMARAGPMRQRRLGRQGGWRLRRECQYKILVWWQSKVLKHWHSRQYNHELIRRRPTVWRSTATSVNPGGRLCQLICSHSAISRSHRGWLSVSCCRQRATHLRKTINAGFAPAMFFDFARRKFRVWSVLPPACASSGPA